MGVGPRRTGSSVVLQRSRKPVSKATRYFGRCIVSMVPSRGDGSPYSLDAAGTLRSEIGASVTRTHIVERGASGERLGRCFGQNSPPTLVCRMRGTLCSPSRNAARPPPFKCRTGRGGSDMIRGSRWTGDSCFQRRATCPAPFDRRRVCHHTNG